MSIDRRESGQSRRRRVLYQTTRDSTPETAAERRSAERLREARRPTASYGSHVNRRLRGRWFSLVPVSRTAMSISATMVLGLALLLTVLHFAAVSWAPLAYNEELARPFRLDRSDSFGSWARCFFLAASSATALLVYQLRRYKVDDYTGSYRIWRSVILLVAILSVDSICHLVPWFGAAIDAGLGKRMALSGADWIRIVLTVGGLAMALRLVAEVRRSKLALVMALLALVAFAIPLLSHWKLIDTSQMRGWMMLTSSPLLASAALWVSFGAYLRMLFREVRGFDAEIAAKKQELAEARKSAKFELDESETPRGWFRWRTKSPTEETPLKPIKPRLATPSKTSSTEPEAKVPLKSETEVKTKRSWFSFGKRKSADSSPADKQSVSAPAKPIAAAAKSPTASVELKTETEKPARKGLGSWLRRDSAAKESVPETKSKPVAAAKPANASASPNAEDDVDDDSVDWGSMNKSERRRLRKEMTRSGRAA